MLKKDGWILEDPALVPPLWATDEPGVPLREFVKDRLYMGVKTGLNDAFVIRQDKRDELVEDDPRSAEIIKPWLRGKDIKRWKADSSGRYIIFANRGIDIDRHPAIEAHLRWFRNDLEKRATAHLHPWYELQQPQEGIYQEFSAHKIIINNVLKFPNFSYDESGAYMSNACFFMVPPSPATTAVLNSSMGSSLLIRQCTLLQNGYIQVFIQFLEQLPIPHLSQEIDQELSKHVETLASNANAPDIESEIDSLVFDAYGLSASERKLVLDWLGERREALGAEMPPDWRKLNALRATAGAWRGSVDGEQLIKDIYASRLIDTRPEPRL